MPKQIVHCQLHKVVRFPRLLSRRRHPRCLPHSHTSPFGISAPLLLFQTLRDSCGLFDASSAYSTKEAGPFSLVEFWCLDDHRQEHKCVITIITVHTCTVKSSIIAFMDDQWTDEEETTTTTTTTRTDNPVTTTSQMALDDLRSLISSIIPSFSFTATDG